MSLNNLKKELESVLRIKKWSPSEKELSLIARRLKEFQGKLTKRDVEKIVYDIVGSYQTIFLEGVDNSDLTTLLLLATKSSSNND